jgi:ABC-2 type transport system permease protein
MFAFGVLLALIFKKPETSNNVGSILFTIMMFFSGIYFPIKFLPHYLQIVSLFLPATYITQFMRYSFGVENLSLIYIYTFNLSVMVISGILLLLTSKRLFALKEE